jgi:uncharacterized iron-regulated protein
MKIVKYFMICSILFPIFLYPQDSYRENYTGKELSHSDISTMFETQDVLIIGEEHDDEKGHKEKESLYRFLVKEHSPILSLEMFERDQQVYLDDYIAGILDDKQLMKETRVWDNFEKDYLPLLKIAKENKISVLASNAPRRYTRIVSKEGLEGLSKLPFESRRYLPPLYLVNAFSQVEYQNKFFSLMGNHGNFGKNLFKAQELWDTTMSHTISEYVSNYQKKVVHVNGRFHSDEGLGVTYRLKKSGMKVLTISMINLSRLDKAISENSKIADILYFSNTK